MTTETKYPDDLVERCARLSHAAFWQSLSPHVDNPWLERRWNKWPAERKAWIAAIRACLAATNNAKVQE